jgi:hypothetical protein
VASAAARDDRTQSQELSQLRTQDDDAAHQVLPASV